MNCQNIVNQNSNQNIEQNIVNQNSNQNSNQIIEQNIVNQNSNQNSNQIIEQNIVNQNSNQNNVNQNSNQNIVNQNSNQNSNQIIEQNIVNQNSNQIIEQNIVNQNSNQNSNQIIEQNIVNQNSNQNNVNQNVEQIKTDDSEHCDSRDHEKFKKCHLLKKEINKEKAEDDTTINLDLKFQKSSQIDLSEFKVISNIGHGSFGKVLLVENIHTHQRYAAKVSFKKICPSQEKNDFFNEIELYSKIDHPAILKLHGYSFQDFEGNPYPTMILDYMKNGTLADFLRKKRHSEKFFYEYKSKKYIMLIGIVIGMRYLHSKGIIHRDLKPENILLDENLYPKICDFGISIISDEELIKKQKERQGTPIYLAPEIAFYEAPYSYRVDVYAFSLIAYELITGKEPFPFNEYHSKFNLWKAIEKGVRPDLSIIPDKQVRYLIGKCWSRDPVERPSFAEIYDILFHSSFSFGCNDLESLNYLNYISDECHYFEFTKDNIEEFAEKGNVKAMNLYSTMLLNGINCPKNIEKSRYYMKKAAETNDKYSLYNYANFLLESENILDKRSGFDILRELANDDYEKAMIDCGNCLTFGIGCKIDYEEAIEYYKMASSRKNAEAMFNLGTMYYRGRGTKIDKKKASEYYHLSADLGNKNAMYEYARMLMSGDGIDKDFEKSEDYFNMAAFQNDTGAMMYLGIMYINGNLPFNPDKAKYWFNKCGELNKNEQFCSQVQNVFQTKNGEYDKTAISVFSIQLTLSMPNTNESEEIPSNTNDSSGEIPSMSNDEFLLNIFKIIFMMKNQSNNNHSFDDESQTNNIDINKKITELKNTYKAGQIDKIKINVYQTLIYDEKKFVLMHFLVDKYFHKTIKKNIDTKARILKAQKLPNIVPRDDPNNVCTYYQFPSYLILTQFQNYINQIMTQNKFECEKLHGNTIYMHFDEKMIDPKELPIFIHYLESIPSVKQIRRNIFDGNQISTYFFVHPDEQKTVKNLLKEFLLKKNLIFDTSLYPLENDIIFKEELILDKKSDFDVIINEIISFKEKKPIVPINIERDKLYFYDDSCINKLFQISTFICFKNKIDKMEALNHINEIVYKGKKNILKYDLELHYSSIDCDGLPTYIRKLIPEIFQTAKGVVDFQPNVLSIESPIHRTYIGFDSMENLKNGYLRYMHFFNIYLVFREKTKLFMKKKDLFYLMFGVKNNELTNSQKVSNLVSDLIYDCQLNCTERKNFNPFYLSYLGFKSMEDMEKAKNRIENDCEISKIITPLLTYDDCDFIYEKAEYKENYLFYCSI